MDHFDSRMSQTNDAALLNVTRQERVVVENLT